MPFTYLGLPLGTTKPTITEFAPLLTKIKRRLSGISKFLFYNGRLILVNSVFSALPTFYMCSIKLPPQVIKQIDIFRKHCLWSKGDIDRRGNCLAAWDIACKPKTQGGLGIIDIQRHNDALLMKFFGQVLQLYMLMYHGSPSLGPNSTLMSKHHHRVEALWGPSGGKTF
jgi:hypothetical protein